VCVHVYPVPMAGYLGTATKDECGGGRTTGKPWKGYPFNIPYRAVAGVFSVWCVAMYAGSRTHSGRMHAANRRSTEQSHIPEHTRERSPSCTTAVSDPHKDSRVPRDSCFFLSCICLVVDSNCRKPVSIRRWSVGLCEYLSAGMCCCDHTYTPPECTRYDIQS
jgi:hypothetical protein